MQDKSAKRFFETAMRDTPRPRVRSRVVTGTGRIHFQPRIESDPVSQPEIPEKSGEDPDT